MALKKDQPASPAEENPDVSDAATSTAKDDAALDSSPEEDEDTWESVIGDALGSDDDDSEQESDSEDEEPETDTAPETGETAEGEPTAPETKGDDDGSDVEEGQRVPYERFRQVIDQRKSWEEKAKTYEQDVQRIRTIDGYMAEHGLAAEDVSDAMQLVSLVKNDPLKALERLQPLVSRLNEYAGQKLPADVQKLVDRGEITEEAAAEVVRHRNEADRYRRQMEQSRQQQQQQTQAQHQQQITRQIVQSVTATETELKNKDPDFQKKLPHLRREIQVRLQRGRPQNPQAAAQMVREAHEQVTRELGAFNPRRPTGPKPSSSDNVRTGELDREPESMDEAIQRALRKGA
jgi:hypothetical protein